MKQKKDGSSPTTKAGAASQYAFSKFKGNPEHAESSKPLCLYCNGRIDSESMLTCTKCIPLLKRTGKALDIASKNNHIPVKESGAPKSIRLRQSVRTGQSRIRVCEICYERKETFDMSRNMEACRHSICTTCISKHIQVKVESNSGKILCPGLHCRVALALDRCKEFLPENVAERWEKTIVETMIPDSEKFYCPFNDCSAMLLNENEEETRMMRESECPHCRRLFCVQCLVPWHVGMECREFQRQNPVERGRDDMKLKELADEKEWMRCPECKSYVEKTEGCVTVTCRLDCLLTLFIYSFYFLVAFSRLQVSKR